MRKGPCRVFTDMELLFVGMESICYTILEFRKITHHSSVHKTQVTPRVVLPGCGSALLQIVRVRRSLSGVNRHGTFICRDRKQLIYRFRVGKDYS